MELLDETWAIEFHSGIPVYKQIINHIQAAIAAGRLKEGDQLPAIRALHQKLDVNPNTVAKAYRELALTGVIVAEHGSGSFVAPPQKKPVLSPKEKKAKVSELCARFVAEAKGHGITPEELARLLNPNQSHV
jgi:GntR family transcriptional regulator